MHGLEPSQSSQSSQNQPPTLPRFVSTIQSYQFTTKKKKIYQFYEENVPEWIPADIETMLQMDLGVTLVLKCLENMLLHDIPLKQDCISLFVSCCALKLHNVDYNRIDILENITNSMKNSFQASVHRQSSWPNQKCKSIVETFFETLPISSQEMDQNRMDQELQNDFVRSLLVLMSTTLLQEYVLR